MPNIGQKFLEDFDLLMKLGVIGLFDHFEIVEIVRYQDGNATPVNVMTIAVALENGTGQKTVKLNQARIRLGAAKDYSFGVFKSTVSADALREALQNYFTTRSWSPNGVPISVGSLEPIAKQFVPPTGSTDVSLNRVLKNNFFTGSYVLELFDVRKQMLQGFFTSPTTLQQLSEAVSRVVPLGISAVADRLGNILIQFPVEAIRAGFGISGSSYVAEIAWHPKIADRSVTITARAEHDKLTISYGQKQATSGVTLLCDDIGHGTMYGSVWDDDNGILLAETGEQAFIKTLSFNFSMITPEPRTIPEGINDEEAKIRIVQSHPPSLSQLGNDPATSIAEPIRQRIYEEELATLTRQRKFVQYGAHPRSGASDRQQALADVRSLISSHGADGVWLWDPFLAPQDILETLFHNPTIGAPMRALTLLKVPVDDGANGTTKDNRLTRYGNQLSGLPGNFLGLKIEFRSAHGPNGWDFHDRFLIFPKSATERAKVWSLGTSVNSLGKSHHILQQVDNAQLIADAFQSLWDAIAQPENVIWKCP